MTERGGGHGRSVWRICAGEERSDLGLAARGGLAVHGRGECLIVVEFWP